MKRIITSIIFVTMLFSCFTIPTFAQTDIDFYVSVKGDDKNNGSEAAPFRTLEKARDVVRTRNKEMKCNINVNIMGGSYYLDKTFELGIQDGGCNGFNVTYKNYKNDKPIISGGRPISGWEQHDGDIWKIKTPEYFNDRFISNVFIGDKMSVMARYNNGDSIASKSLIDIPEVPSLSKVDGAVFKSEDFELKEAIVGMQDFILNWDWNWRNYWFPIEKSYKDVDGNTVMQFVQPDPGIAIAEMYIPSVYQFRIKNAYEFIDEVGEFYYNRSQQTIYYKKDAKDDLNSEVTVVPYLDQIMTIQGDDTKHKVQNLTVEGLQFSHSMSQRTFKAGATSGQGIEGKVHLQKDSLTYPNPMFLNTTAVWASYGKNINVKNNVFCQMDTVALGFYDAVEDSTIIGNAFYDTNDTAIIGGTQGHAIDYENDFAMGNVAMHKPTTASGSAITMNSSRLVDSDPISNWLDNSSPSWAQIDLLQKYEIDKIMVQINMAFPTDKNDFEVWASNTPTFSEYEILGRQLLSSGEIKKIKGLCTYEVGDPKKYRYIRVNQKSAMSLGDIMVFSKDAPGGYGTEPCKNVKIQNNVIANVVREYWSGAAMQIFYVNGFDISHNDISNVPYTGISFGWGWTTFKDEKTTGNNKINYNRFNETNQRMHDGGAIYALGTQPNSEMVGNYITNAINAMGGIYPDNGSAYWLMKENIMENVPISFHPWAADQWDMKMVDNYTSTPYFVVGARNTTIENTELFVRGQMPEHIKEKAKLAGIQKEYKYVLDKVYRGNKSPVAPTLIDGKLGRTNYAPISNWNYGFSLLRSAMLEGEYLLKTAKNSNLITAENQKTVDTFEDLVLDVKDFLFSDKASDMDLYYGYLGDLQKAINDFTMSGIFTKDNYKVTRQDFGIATEDKNTTVISDNAVITGEKFVTDYENFAGPGKDTIFRKRDKSSIQLARTGGMVTYYVKEKYQNVTFDLNTQIKRTATDFPGYIMRASNSNVSPGEAGFSGYIIGFVDDGIEVQRFNDVKRTVFYGNIGSYEPVCGPVIPYDGLDVSKTHNAKVSTVNEKGGVRIILTIDGKEIFNIFDNSKDAVKDGGYFGMWSPGGEMQIFKEASK